MEHELTRIQIEMENDRIYREESEEFIRGYEACKELLVAYLDSIGRK